jgi:hypothetical protein
MIPFSDYATPMISIFHFAATLSRRLSLSPMMPLRPLLIVTFRFS